MKRRGTLALLAAGLLTHGHGRAAAGDVEPAADAAPRARAPFVRAGAGIAHGELFVGSDRALPFTGAAIHGMIVSPVGRHLAVTIPAAVETGRSPRGLPMHHVQLGLGIELRARTFFAGAGSHASWVGVERASGGAEPLVWRLGLGAGLILGVDVPFGASVGIFCAVRGVIDYLPGRTDASFGSVGALAGMSFR